MQKEVSRGLNRRGLLAAIGAAGVSLAAGPAVASPRSTPRMTMPLSSDKTDSGSSALIRAAAVQFRSGRCLANNVERHCHFIKTCAQSGAAVVVFPECSITGYDEEAIRTANSSDLQAAEQQIGAEAKAHNVTVVAGIPTRTAAGVYNSALVFSPEGSLLERYHKIQLAGEKWAIPGDHLAFFMVGGVPASLIICHDERYPELVRLPVMAGARLVFYISHESGMDKPEKIEPYRAQIVARAVENNVYVVQSNAPAERESRKGSHGQSRIITPSGQILVEAGIYDEEVCLADLDLSQATGNLAARSRQSFLKGWWDQGIEHVRKKDVPAPTQV